VIRSGIVDVSATKTSDAVDRLLAFASTRSIARQAPREGNPLAHDPWAVK